MHLTEVILMSEIRTTKSILLITIMMISLSSPIFSSISSAKASTEEEDKYEAEGVVIGDLKDFDPANGREYLLIEEEMAVVSAYGFMKQAWIDAGMPGVEEMKYSPMTQGRASARSCNPHLVGDTLNVPTSGGSINAYVAKTTNTVAFVVQSGRTLSSTVLNNLASSWDSTIYPTMTTYYGKDYQDGRGLAPPDVDNNCQVQIVIYDIDGAYNTGGYFAPSFFAALVRLVNGSIVSSHETPTESLILAVLGPFWTSCWLSWDLLGRLLEPLGPPFGASWRLLGASWGDIQKKSSNWPPTWPMWDSKRVPK